jgi:hypothetical protein
MREDRYKKQEMVVRKKRGSYVYMSMDGKHLFIVRSL